MSAEGGASQPPPAPSEKAPAPKPVATFSSFINKNTSGKKVAPKAARRRPGAVAAAAPAPKPPASTSTSTDPAPESQTAQNAPSSNAPTIVEPQAAEQLPTPAATQEPSPQTTPQTEKGAAGPSSSNPNTATLELPPYITVEPSPASPSTPALPPYDKDVGSTSRLSPARSKTPRRAEEVLESGRSPKRQRVQASTTKKTAKPKPAAAPTASIPTTQESSAITQPAQAEARPTTDSTPEQAAITTAQANDTATAPSTDSPAEATTSITQQNTGEDIASVPPQPTQQSQPTKRERRLPWATVNPSRDEEEEVVASGAGTRSRPTARARGERKSAPAADDDEVDEENDEEHQPAPKRPSAKARRTRKATGPVLDDDAEGVEPPAKKSRRTRKDKGTKKNKPSGPEEEGEDGEAAEGTQSPKQKKATRKKKKIAPPAESGAEVEGEPADGVQPTKRKGGRRPRADTPSDAEDEVIEPATTFMTQLASGRIRSGKLSDRERKMREIDWKAVKERRREQEINALDGGRAARNQVEEELARAGQAREEAAQQQNTGPQMRVVDGQIQLVQDSGMIDREADANREIALMEEVDEDDLTAHITSRTYMRDNKRHPQDFMLPGQGTRWTKEGTELFYDGLVMWGTDFDIISKMFPGTTRKSIKLKFNREERSDPERIHEVMRGPRKPDFDLYLALSGRTAEMHVDVKAINAELEELEKQTEAAIEAAKAARLEENRQRALAGAQLSEDETGDKENGKKGKGKGKGKKGQESVQSAPEDGVEILGSADGWAAEALGRS